MGPRSEVRDGACCVMCIIGARLAGLSPATVVGRRFPTEASHPTTLRHSASSRAAPPRWTIPFTAAGKSPVDEAGSSQRRARFVGERVSPCFAIGERFCRSAKCTVDHGASILRAVGRAARDYDPPRSLPDTWRVADYPNAPELTARLDGDREQPSLALWQVPMRIAHPTQRCLDRDRHEFEISPAHFLGRPGQRETASVRHGASDSGHWPTHTGDGAGVHAAKPNRLVASPIQRASGTFPSVALSISSAISREGKRSPVAYRLIDA